MATNHSKIVKLLQKKEEIEACELWAMLRECQSVRSEEKKPDDNNPIDRFRKKNSKNKKSGIASSVADENFGSLLHCALSRPSAIVKMIINSMDFNDLLLVDDDGNTPLQVAIINGHRESAHSILAGGSKIFLAVRLRKLRS